MQFLGFLSGEPVVMLFQIKLTVKFKRMLVSVQNLFENGPRWSLFPLLSNLSTFIIGYIVYWQIVLLIPDWIWCCWGVRRGILVVMNVHIQMKAWVDFVELLYMFYGQCWVLYIRIIGRFRRYLPTFAFDLILMGVCFDSNDLEFCCFCSNKLSIRS